jgi:hypothetical protein
MASPFSAPEEGGVLWRGCGVQRLVTLTVSSGQHCSRPHPRGGGEGNMAAGVLAGREPSLWERRGLLSLGISSKLMGVISELKGVSSKLNRG